jgi:hypothetical protein
VAAEQGRGLGHRQQESPALDPIQRQLDQLPIDAYQSVWGAAPDYVWVGGLEGLQRFDGMTFLPLEHPETESFVALWGVGRDDFWAVGGLGMITHRAGDRWEHRDQKSRATSNSFTGVWGSGPDATWVVGDGGTLMRHRR